MGGGILHYSSYLFHLNSCGLKRLSYWTGGDPNLEDWHKFGMEWKEHVAWLAPILATAVAFIVLRYGVQLANEPRLRRVLLVLFSLAFLCAAVAGLFGAFITKTAPIL